MKPAPAIYAAMIASLGVCACASSETPPSPAPAADGGFSVLTPYDLDRSGSVDPEEFAAAKTERFARRDQNSDGMITRAEFDAVNEAMRGRLEDSGLAVPTGGLNRDPFPRLDSNGDGSVSEAEFMANDGQFVTRADADGDGVTTQAEADAFMERVQRFMSRR